MKVAKNLWSDNPVKVRPTYRLTVRCAVIAPFIFISKKHNDGKSTRNNGTAGNDSVTNQTVANIYGLPAKKGSG